jgi:hypothetical protein
MTLFQSRNNFPALILVAGMLLVASLATFCFLAPRLAANPVVARDSPTGFSLPIVKCINPNGTLNVVQRDQARAASFANRAGVSILATVPDLPLSDNGNVYVASIGVGNPPINCESRQFLPCSRLYAHFRRAHR